MNIAVAERLSESSQNFNRLIKTDLEATLRGQLEVVEGVTVTEIAKNLDILAGIDIWYIHRLNGMRGIASRIQPSDRSWDTFTIRHKRESGAKTEYEKRKSAIKDKYLYPYLTLQAYVKKDGSRLISYGLARTEDILKYCDSILERYDFDVSRIPKRFYNRTGNKEVGQASFFIVHWDDFEKAGYKIVIKKFNAINVRGSPC